MINIGVAAEEKNKNLDRLLMSSIFNILPNIKRIFLFIRPTNLLVLEMYQIWGFTQDHTFEQDPNHKVNLEYLIPLEYKIDQSGMKAFPT